MMDLSGNQALFTNIHGIKMTQALAKERIQQSSYLQTWYMDLKADAEQLMDESIPVLTYKSLATYIEDGERDAYQLLYFKRRRRLNAFAILLLIDSSNTRYQSHLEDMLWSICEEWTWCLPAHLDYDEAFGNNPAYQQLDLFSAETAFTLAEILTMHEERLPLLIKKHIRYEIDRRVFQPFIASKHHWEQAEHNWSAVCSGSIGASAIYLLDGERLQHILEKSIRSVEYFERSLSNDGICQEGYHYWQYGFGYYIYFADLLFKRTSGTVDLLSHSKIEKAANFQQKVFMGEKTVANFSDALEQASPLLGLSHYLHHRYEHVHLPCSSSFAPYGHDPCYRFAPAIRDLLWFDKKKEGSNWPIHESCFQETQWFLKNTRYNEHLIGFAAKGGHNAEPHNHNDLGHFMLYINGVSLLSDLGAGHYNKHYFGSSRYDFLTNSSLGHSVPIIDGYSQSEGVDAKSQQFSYSEQQLSLELSAAYPDIALRSFQRKWQLELERGFVRLVDSFSCTPPVSITERFISLGEVINQEVGKVQLFRSGYLLTIFYDSERARLQIHQDSFIDHAGEAKEVVLLDFMCDGERADGVFSFDFQLGSLT